MNEFNTDFNRLQELFLTDATLRIHQDLPSLISIGLMKFLKKYGQGITQKEPVYLHIPGAIETKSGITLALFSPHGVPELNGLHLQGNTANPLTLLTNLDGRIEAEYDGLSTHEFETIMGNRLRRMVRYERRISWKGYQFYFQKANE